MSNNYEQNGCQPPMPQQTTPLSDPRVGNIPQSNQQIKICRDYVWGICTKGFQCKFRHELEVESMKSILKFCHDFQNRTGCTRPDCSYLHTSREEQNHFLATGQIPRVLAERHAAIAAMNMGPEGVPQAMYEYMTQPPPPPPPTAPEVNGLPPPLPAPMSVPIAPVTTSIPASIAPLPTALTLLAPPPPPPPTLTSTSVHTTTPIYSAPPPQNPPATYPMTQSQPPLPAMFDASRPPPPLPANIKKGAIKRSAEQSEAGASKVRKMERCKMLDSPCEKCIQRQISIELYSQESQKLECEKEYKSYILEKKTEQYENGKLLLKSVVSPELYRIIDNYIESSSQTGQVSDLLALYNNQNSSMLSNTATAHVPKQFLLQLMDYVFGNPRHFIDPTSSPASVDENPLLQSLTNLVTRRANPVNHTSPDPLQLLADVLRAASLPNDRNLSVESRSNEYDSKAQLPVDPNRPGPSNINNGGNGIKTLNGQKVNNSPPIVRVSPDGYPSTSSIVPTTVPQYVGPPTKVKVQPQPPPQPPPAVRPSTLTAPPPPVQQNHQTYSPYFMGSYPPNYYPPYQ